MWYKKYVIVVLLVTTNSLGAEQKESFFAQEQPVKVRKKKSMSALREELGELFEDFAHDLLDEIAAVADYVRRATEPTTDCAGKPRTWVTKPKNQTTLVVERLEQLAALQRFLTTGNGEDLSGLKAEKQKVGEPKAKKLTMSDPLALIQQLTKIEQQLLRCIRRLLEKNSDSCFVCSGRATLTEQITYIKKSITMTKEFKDSILNS